MHTPQQIIEATTAVIRAKGLVGATTREIARAANCAEGTIYNHFANKEELFIAVLIAQLPTFTKIVEDRLARAGEGDLATNLADIALAAIRYYDMSTPLASAFFADPALLGRFQATLQELHTGPQRVIQRVAAYMQAEQRFGRLDRHIDATVAALLLIGPCFQYAYTRSFVGAEPFETDEQAIVADLVATALPALTPKPGDHGPGISS